VVVQHDGVACGGDSSGESSAVFPPRGGTVWLSQRAIADLYATTVTNVNHIIRRILDDGEVTGATIDSESIVRQEGTRQVRREIALYDLDMILAIGYRVTTRQAVLFRMIFVAPTSAPG
jgi:hypothetical protein